MGSIIAIGTAVIDTILHTEAVLDTKICNKVGRSYADGGAIRNVAHNLSLLKDDVLFWAKFGNDTVALDMLTRTEMLGIQVHAKFINLPTPHFYQLFSSDTALMISTTTPDFYFDKTDLLPTFLIRSEKYGITDQDDYGFLKKLYERSPDLKWIALGFLPPIELQEMFCAVFLNRNEALRYADSTETFFKLAFYFPLVVVTQDTEGLLYMKDEDLVALPAPVLGKGNVLGMGDALVAGFLHKYIQELPVTDCLDFGIQCAQKTSEVHSAINPQLAQLI